MEYTVYAKVIRTYEETIEADSIEEAERIMKIMYNEGSLDNYDDELTQIEAYSLEENQ